MNKMQDFKKILFVLLTVSAFAGGAAAQGTPSGIPVQIISEGQMSADVMVSFLLSRNPNAVDVPEIAWLYIEEAAAEGVNHDIAFAQMCLETGYLRFSGMVPRSYNNFGGFGAFKGNTPNRFATVQEGVRAQIQHLKAYASNEGMHYPLVDPRYVVLQELRYIGTAPTVFALAGKWATDKEYASKIVAIMAALYQTAE